MFNTAFTFGLTQFARSLSLPERLQKRPFRNAALEPWRFRNSSLDAMFYDIKTLTSDEAFYISDSIAAEGMLMIVPPTGKGMLTLCDSVDEYILRGGLDVHVMAVAGIGGSAAGAAAFARNVADAVDAPVAAVVSGYGLGDILSESMGSNFLFGPLGFLRRNFEMIDDLVGRPKLGDYNRHHTTATAPRRSSLDTDTVEALLMNNKLEFQLITGHSKGNLIIADALRSLEVDAPERLETLGKTLKLISFSTRISVPAAVEAPLAIMGELDWYGELNATAPAAGTIRVARCGHSTNSDMPGALKITSLLRNALGDATTKEPEIVPEPELEKETPALHLVKTVETAPDLPREETVTADVPDVTIVEDEEPIAKAEAEVEAETAIENTAVLETVSPEPTPEPEPSQAPEAESNPLVLAAAPEKIEETAAEETVAAEQTTDTEMAAQPETRPKTINAPKAKRPARSNPRRNRKP
jgi:hypothetical protein